MAALGVVQMLTVFARGYLFLRLEERVGNELRQSIVHGVLAKDVRSLEGYWTGDLIARIVNDAAVLRGLLTGVLFQVVIDGLTLLAVGVALVRIDARLAALTLLAAPLSLFYIRSQQGALESAHRLVREGIASFTSTLQTWLSAPFALKAFRVEAVAAARLQARNNELTRASIGVGTLVARVGGINMAALSAPSMLIFGYGGYIALSGGLSIGEFFAFIAFSSYFTAPLHRLLGIYAQIPQFHAAHERLSALGLEWAPPAAASVERKNHAVSRLRVSGLEIREKDAPSFSIRVESFAASSGELVGLKGANGSGKSRFLRALLRLEANEGIVVEGTDGREVPPAPGLYAFQGQQPALFDGSIVDNVTLFDPQPDLEHLQRIVAQLDLEGWIRSLPRGWDTRCEEALGWMISGGEAKKIALARVLYAASPIWLLDEPEAGLDKSTAEKVLGLLSSAAKERIVVVATHSTKVLSMCDRVYELCPVAGDSIDGSRPHECRPVIGDGVGEPHRVVAGVRR
jgi:ABC-type bacteriocin/lantibiotic exporter with double-glycine peptidase domain